MSNPQPYSTASQQSFLIFLLLVVGLVACGAEPATPTPQPLHPGPVECERAIEVFVWGDLNGDGLKTPNEPPLAGVLLLIAQRDAPTEENIQLETQQNGRAYFPTFELEDCQTAGYDLLFVREVARYQFPAEPVVNLDDYQPLNNTIEFPLLQKNDNGE